MSQHILLVNGKVIPVQTLRSLTAAEIDSSIEKAKRDEFDLNIRKLYGTSSSVPPNWVKRRRKDTDGVQYIDDSSDTEDVDSLFGNQEILSQTTHLMPQVDNVPDFDSFVQEMAK